MSRIISIAIFLTLIHSAFSAAQPLCLTRQDADPSPAHSPLLVRELFRQGVLIAARDAMHLSTRDQALREPFPKDTTPLDLQWAITRDSIYISLLRAGKALWQTAIPLPIRRGQAQIYPISVEASEKLAWKDWVGVLEKAGFAAKGNAASGNAAAPAKAVEDLAHLDIVHQFQALRQTQAAIAANGASPRRLGVLVEANANLGRLTDALWCDDSDVFAARSLLYAQHMVAEQPSSSYALWHRAYAYALAGCPRPAMDDLAAAQKLVAAGQNSDPKNLAKPAWVGTIDAFCRDDIGGLSKAVSQGQAAPLSALLRFFCVEFSGSDDAKFTFEQAALRLSPACERLLDAMNMDGALSVMEQSTRDSFAMLHASIAGLNGWADLPATAKAELQKPADPQSPYMQDSRAAAALVGSTDDAEPSYALLGRLLQEQMFSNVFSEAYLLDHMLGVDASGFVNSNMPLIAEHPYHDWLKVMTGNDRDPEYYFPLAKIKLIDPTALMFTRIHDDAWAKTGGANPAMDAWNFLVREHDMTAQRLEVYIARIYGGKDKTRIEMAHHLLAISPYDAIARAVLIENDFDSVAERVPRWRQEDAEHPAVLAALANHYFDAGEYELAKDALRQRILVMPDVTVFIKLADVYLKENNEADWLKEMQHAMEQQTYGLERPSIEMDIAHHYMDEKKFQEAKPYADGAANSYVAWAMTCAIECDEALGDWDEAGKWVDARGERYGNAPEWYFWCQRTGHGNLMKATMAMQVYVWAIKPGAGRDQLANALEFYVLQKDYPDAIKMARAIFDPTGDTWAGMHLALLLDRDGKRAEAEKVLDRVRTGVTAKQAGSARTQIVAVAGLMDDCLRATDKEGKAAKLDLQAVEKASAGASPRDQGHIDFFVGRFLEVNKQSPQEMEKLWKSAAGIKESSSSVLAAARLREGKGEGGL